MKLGLLGHKIKMGNIFQNDGSRTPVTFVELLPLTVTQVKRSDGPDRYNSIQVGWEPVAGHKLTRAEIGHQKNITGKPRKRLAEMRVDSTSDYSIDQKLDWNLIKIGDIVDVTGTSKGRGTAGVMKRYNFKGAPASHGVSKVHRKPMSAGATDAARVFKGKKNPGHMGHVTVTIKNLEIMLLDEEHGVIAVKGAIPGPSGSLVKIVPTVQA